MKGLETTVLLKGVTLRGILSCLSCRERPTGVIRRCIQMLLFGFLVLPPFTLLGQIVEGDSIYHVLPKDAIPAILSPSHLTANKAQEIMAPDEQIIGVVGPNGTAIAYST